MCVIYVIDWVRLDVYEAVIYVGHKYISEGQLSATSQLWAKIMEATYIERNIYTK